MCEAHVKKIAEPAFKAKAKPSAHSVSLRRGAEMLAAPATPTGLWAIVSQLMMRTCSGSRRTNDNNNNNNNQCCKLQCDILKRLLEKKKHISGKAAAAAAKSLQSCPTLCDPRDCSPPGSPIPGILQARTLEWVAISFSNA